MTSADLDQHQGENTLEEISAQHVQLVLEQHIGGENIKAIYLKEMQNMISRYYASKNDHQ